MSYDLGCDVLGAGHGVWSVMLGYDPYVAPKNPTPNPPFVYDANQAKAAWDAAFADFAREPVGSNVATFFLQAAASIKQLMNMGDIASANTLQAERNNRIEVARAKARLKGTSSGTSTMSVTSGPAPAQSTSTPYIYKPPAQGGSTITVSDMPRSTPVPPATQAAVAQATTPAQVQAAASQVATAAVNAPPEVKQEVAKAQQAAAVASTPAQVEAAKEQLQTAIQRIGPSSFWDKEAFAGIPVWQVAAAGGGFALLVMLGFALRSKGSRSAPIAAQPVPAIT